MRAVVLAQMGKTTASVAMVNTGVVPGALQIVQPWLRAMQAAARCGPAAVVAVVAV